MRRYVLAYAAWLTCVLVMATVAFAWYCYVEEITTREALRRMTNPHDA